MNFVQVLPERGYEASMTSVDLSSRCRHAEIGTRRRERRSSSAVRDVRILAIREVSQFHYQTVMLRSLVEAPLRTRGHRCALVVVPVGRGWLPCRHHRSHSSRIDHRICLGPPQRKLHPPDAPTRCSSGFGYLSNVRMGLAGLIQEAAGTNPFLFLQSSGDRSTAAAIVLHKDSSHTTWVSRLRVRSQGRERASVTALSRCPERGHWLLPLWLRFP